jgi:hypothetical protein
MNAERASAAAIFTIRCTETRFRTSHKCPGSNPKIEGEHLCPPIALELQRRGLLPPTVSTGQKVEMLRLRIVQVCACAEPYGPASSEAGLFALLSPQHRERKEHFF